MSKAEGKAKGKPGAQEVRATAISDADTMSQKAAAKLREERAITERLAREGLARKDVPKDGACLVRPVDRPSPCRDTDASPFPVPRHR